MTWGYYLLIFPNSLPQNEFILRCILFKWTHFVNHFTVLHKSIVEMAIRRAAAKILLLKCWAPPNNPLSHSKTSSIWFLDHCGAGSVMVGTSDLSAAVLRAPPPARPRHTWLNLFPPQRMWSYQQKNKPACYQSEPVWGFSTIAMTLNQTEAQDTDAFLDAWGEYVRLLINVFNWAELLGVKSKRVVGGKSESSMQSDVLEDVDGDYSQGCCNGCQAIQVAFFYSQWVMW